MRRLIALALTLVAGPAVAQSVPPLVDPAWLAERSGDVAVLDISDDGGPTLPGAIVAPYGSAGWRTTRDGVPYEIPPLDAVAGLIGGLGIGSGDHVVIVPEGSSSTEFAGATRVYWTLKYLGHDAVSILDGGFRAWRAAGGATGAPATPEAVTFRPEPQPDLLVGLAAVTDAVGGDAVLVDARPPAQYAGQATTGLVPRAGTIPGARNLPHDTLYDAEAMRFVTPEALADLAAARGIDTEAPIIAFCNTGHWGSIAWFALSEVLGADAALYDGGMAEWAADPDRPVVTP